MNAWLSNDRLEKWMQLLWGIVLLFMPVSSFRWLPSVIGSTQVRPLAFLPLALLVPLLGVYLLRTRSLRWPAELTPLLAFLLAAAVSTGLGGLYAPLALRGHSYWEWALRAWLSLLIGMGFFSVAVMMAGSKDFLRRSLPWLYAGLAITICWGVLQAVAQNTSLISVKALNKIQLAISIRGILDQRVSGFAYEPSWLGDQITILYFPWLFAAVITNYRATRHKWLEPVLVVGALGLLLLTYSRSGILGLVFSVAVAKVTVGRDLIRRVWAWFWSPFKSTERRGLWLRVAILLLIVLILVGALWWFNRLDYFSNLWNADLSSGLAGYFEDVAAGARYAYSVAGFNVFSLHPWFGVGLGGSSFYLFDQLPDWALSGAYEVAQQLSPDSHLMPNVRNMYVRFLSETGIVGFWLYLAFMISILGSIRKMALSNRMSLAFVAAAGMTAWASIALRLMTQSTLTSPVIWTMLGMVVGYANAGSGVSSTDVDIKE